MVLKKVKFCCGQGNLTFYYCEICGIPYATEEEAEECEKKYRASMHTRVNLTELNKFTYSVYDEFLRFLRTHYKIIPLSETPETDPPYVALRHDVDGSLEAALRMAEIEQKLGIPSTYFVLFSSSLYNPLAKRDLKLLRQISRLNHEIGLHYDLEVLETEGLERQIDILEHLVGRPVKGIARHRESETKFSFYLQSQDRIGAEDTRFYDLHISDSIRVWEEDKLRALLSFQYDEVQVSLHPFLWTAVEMDRFSCLKQLFDRVRARNEETHLKWLGIWRNES